MRVNVLQSENASMQTQLKEANKRAQEFNDREKVFGFPPTEYPQLFALEQDLAPFLTLWNMISDFHSKQQEWLYGSFLELNGNEIQKEVEDWWRVSRKLIAQLEEGHEGASLCSAELHRETGQFRENLPVVISLASKAPKHSSTSRVVERSTRCPHAVYRCPSSSKAMCGSAGSGCMAASCCRPVIAEFCIMCDVSKIQDCLGMLVR